MFRLLIVLHVFTSVCCSIGLGSNVMSIVKVLEEKYDQVIATLVTRQNDLSEQLQKATERIAILEDQHNNSRT